MLQAAVSPSPQPAASGGGASSIDWVSAGVHIGAIVVVALIVSWIGRAAVKRMRKRLDDSGAGTAEINLRRSTTITSTLTNFILVVVWSVAVLMILSELGVNLAPLLASAGIAGVALSFGAQSLVRDFLVGFFIILEDQFSVGDTIGINVTGGSFEGRVEDLTLRYTSVRGSDGTLYEVGNGNILFVANRSRGTGRITVDVRVPRAGTLHEMERRLDDVVEEMRAEPSIRQLVAGGPTVVGVEPVGDSTVQASISAEIWASRRQHIEATLRRELGVRLAARQEHDAS
ncbi:MAG TPA: mechanosensitive ion channel family protein [Actinomycetota bacterium]|jgi:small conductance mechanosensitive channel